MMRHGGQGQQTRKNTAGMSAAAAQDALRALVWDDLVTDLKAPPHGEEAITELERLRTACNARKSVNMRSCTIELMLMLS